MKTSSKKLKQIRIAAIALGGLLLLILLSGRIYNFNRPIVTAAMPARGYLNHREITSGVVRYAESAELYADISGRIYRVLVREGDAVIPGQAIIELDFRTSPLDARLGIESVKSQIADAEAQFNERLDGLRIDRESNQIELERINADIQNITRQIEELQNIERTCPDFLSIFRQMDEIRYSEFQTDLSATFELRQNLEDITQAMRHSEQMVILYNAGIAAAQELIDSENNLAALERRHEVLQQQYETRQVDWTTGQENQLRDLEHQLETRRRDRDTRLRELNHQLEMRRRDRGTRNLDAENLTGREETLRRELASSIADSERRIADYQRRLSEYEATTITSPVTGVITNLHVNQGQHITANQLLAGIGLTQAFVVETEIPLNNNFVASGDSVRLRNASQLIEGVVTQIVPVEQAKRVTIAVEAGTVTAGETFTITFEERSYGAFTLVPNSAIGRDGQGYFINQVQRRRGILGNEFYTQRVRVTVGDSDDQHTAILHGITVFRPIVSLSERAFTEGQSIRLRNEGDFFEN